MNKGKIGKTAVAVALCAAAWAVGAAERIELNGAGGSFPAPLYQAWAYAYTQEGTGAKVNYQSVGSSAGISQIKAGTVDFAGTDARLAALNPGLKLPALKITVVHRGDGSGTTHIFSTYLAAVSPDWKEQVGAGTLLKWPCGIAGQKNPGVCNGVRRIRGAIGYTEYTFAREAKLGIVNLRGASGAAVEPTSAGWPILGKTYILVRKDTPPARRAALQAYFDWCFAKGGDTAKRLFYIPGAR